ncbi:hypothetical protein N7468_002060 [Penicillium chermesinum]|uniref:Retrotransposon gag domain-containing protein n=1 Tax=Penicillium chermesinum TaxID=63820 RepID=A0A9W9PKN2_9EURO|nr:uncharacterized protein N7468_002060 [Penicillium chermesinum]KAJ5247077.1 hypothetical protein N7468_002060 [Penicillium chermesinum]
MEYKGLGRAIPHKTTYGQDDPPETFEATTPTQAPTVVEGRVEEILLKEDGKRPNTDPSEAESGSLKEFELKSAIRKTQEQLRELEVKQIEAIRTEIKHLEEKLRMSIKPSSTARSSLEMEGLYQVPSTGKYVLRTDIAPDASDLPRFDGRSKEACDFMCTRLEWFFEMHEGYFINDERKILCAVDCLPPWLQMRWMVFEIEYYGPISYGEFLDWIRQFIRVPTKAEIKQAKEEWFASMQKEGEGVMEFSNRLHNWKEIMDRQPTEAERKDRLYTGLLPIIKVEVSRSGEDVIEKEVPRPNLNVAPCGHDRLRPGFLVSTEASNRPKVQLSFALYSLGSRVGILPE